MLPDWSIEEVAETRGDYFAWLAAELFRVPYNKAAHRRARLKRLSGRFGASPVEFKHAKYQCGAELTWDSLYINWFTTSIQLSRPAA